MKSIVESKPWRKKIVSIVLISILVASSVLVFLTVFEPKAGALLYHDNSAAWEDGDFGGGLDYNGDPAGDNKVTWHPANNSHVITSDFVVPDDYVLEIEAGCIVQSDPGVNLVIGQGASGALYVNGTPGNPVLMEPNGTGVWGRIYFFPGSYGSIENAWIDQSEYIYVGGATLDINATAITNTDSFGIYASSSTVTITYSVIMNTNNQGIYALNSDLMASYCFISNAQSAAISCEASNAMIEKSDIYGYNSSAGLNGGHAIYVAGPSSYMIISQNNRIIGGAGGPDSGSGGGNGGMGVFDANYNGQLSVVDNQIIKGGAGGNNFSPGAFAGSGGIGVHVVPFSDIAPSPSVNISGNTLILGGRGGDNDAPLDGSAGNGGVALRLTDSPVGSAGDAYVGYNTDIIGGEGGHNHADASASGWIAGEGGEGIYIQGVKKPASALIEQNPNIIGGAGGNNTGAGNFITQAGEGGSGILLWNATDVTIQSSKVTGGHGGNNTLGGVMASAGDGGNGIFLYYPNSAFSSAALISGCSIYGGEGGDDYVGMAGAQGGSGEGGSGIYSSQSYGTCISSEVYGGKGGDNFGWAGVGGGGGYGTAFFNSFGWGVSGGTITGGKGGSNFDFNGGGGPGEYAALVSNSNFASFSMVSYITGGDGGDAIIGDLGPGEAAIATVYLSTSSDVSLMRNDIVTGVGGFNASSGGFGANGSYCVYADNLDGSNTILGNDITTNFRGGNTYGIRMVLALTGTATIEGNDIYLNNVGVYIQNSNGVTIGSGNNIFNNNYGAYLIGSDVTMGPYNIISNNGYGVYCDGSSPTITEDQIIDSSTVGLYFSSNSNAIVKGSIIDNSNLWNVYSESGSSPQFYNSSLYASSGGGEFYQTGDSHPWLLNTTFDKAKTGFGDALSNISVNWYMHIKVIETSFLPVAAATVWVNDTDGNNLFILSTDGSGWARWNIVTEYIEDTSGYEYYFTPHNASAWEGGRYGNTLPEMTLSRNVIIMLDGISYDLPVKKGWNMISVALNQSSTLLEDVLNFMDGKYTAVQWFDVTDASDPWKHYHIDKPSILNDLTDIDKTMALWVLMDNDDILSIAGLIPIPTTTDIQLRTGWNFVGYPSITSRIAGESAGEAFESISGFVDMVQYYDAADSANLWKEWDPGAMSPDDLTNINSGMGLWIHVTGDCIWSVDW